MAEREEQKLWEQQPRADVCWIGNGIRRGAMLTGGIDSGVTGEYVGRLCGGRKVQIISPRGERQR